MYPSTITLSICLIHFLTRCFFFNDTATPEIYTLSLHDALPILPAAWRAARALLPFIFCLIVVALIGLCHDLDRKSTRLNSSHMSISYAVFCLKKKNKTYSSLIILSTCSSCTLLL